MQTTQIVILVCAGLGMFALLGLVTFLSSHYNLDGIKSKTVGDGQYGTARFATVSGRVDSESHPEALYRKCGFEGQDIWHVLRES